MTIVRKMQLFSLFKYNKESGAKMYNFRITKGGIFVVNYAVLGKRTKKKADTKYLHFPKIK